MFSWALPRPSTRHNPARRSLLKLAAAAGVTLALGSVGLFMLTRSPQNSAGITAQASIASPQPEPTVPVTEEVPLAAAEVKPERPLPVRKDDELKQLREKRINGQSANSSELIRTLISAEKKYPDDYRFSYERAKVAIKLRRPGSRGEAFAALSRAAEKAINNGRAREMLNSLEVDRTGDFRRLAQSRREWGQLQEALKSRDAKGLNARMGM
jgi:hypothetical protein